MRPKVPAGHRRPPYMRLEMIGEGNRRFPGCYAALGGTRTGPRGRSAVGPVPLSDVTVLSVAGSTVHVSVPRARGRLIMVMRQGLAVASPSPPAPPSPPRGARIKTVKNESGLQTTHLVAGIRDHRVGQASTLISNLRPLRTTASTSPHQHHVRHPTEYRSSEHTSSPEHPAHRRLVPLLLPGEASLVTAGISQALPQSNPELSTSQLGARE